MYHDLNRGVRGWHHMTRFLALGFGVVAPEAEPFREDWKVQPAQAAFRQRYLDALAVAKAALALPWVDTSRVYTFGEGFGGGMDTVSADMQGAMGSAGTLTAQEAVQAVNDGIIANIGALDGAVSAIVERVTAGLTAQAARLNQIGVDMTKYIASGMTTGTPNITNIIPQIVQSIITAFTAQQPKFTAAGVDIDKAIASGMVQGTPQITAKIQQIIQSILTTINGFVSQFTAAGEEMVRGIWQGFQNMSGWLESKVRSMMREIVAAVEAEMQIASPSKVFAGIGAYMAEGLGEGFAREMQNVEKTIRRATASTVPEPQRPSGRISRNDNAARGVQVVQNIYANETSYAQQQREAAKQFRLIAREVMG